MDNKTDHFALLVGKLSIYKEKHPDRHLMLESSAIYDGWGLTTCFSSPEEAKEALRIVGYVHPHAKETSFYCIPSVRNGLLKQ
jgi:hypothetical protein